MLASPHCAIGGGLTPGRRLTPGRPYYWNQCLDILFAFVIFWKKRVLWYVKLSSQLNRNHQIWSQERASYKLKRIFRKRRAENPPVNCYGCFLPAPPPQPQQTSWLQSLGYWECWLGKDTHFWEGLRARCQGQHLELKFLEVCHLSCQPVLYRFRSLLLGLCRALGHRADRLETAPASCTRCPRSAATEEARCH